MPEEAGSTYGEPGTHRHGNKDDSASEASTASETATEQGESEGRNTESDSELEEGGSSSEDSREDSSSQTTESNETDSEGSGLEPIGDVEFNVDPTVRDAKFSDGYVQIYDMVFRVDGSETLGEAVKTIDSSSLVQHLTNEIASIDEGPVQYRDYDSLSSEKLSQYADSGIITYRFDVSTDNDGNVVSSGEAFDITYEPMDNEEPDSILDCYIVAASGYVNSDTESSNLAANTYFAHGINQIGQIDGERVPVDALLELYEQDGYQKYNDDLAMYSAYRDVYPVAGLPWTYYFEDGSLQCVGTTQNRETGVIDHYLPLLMRYHITDITGEDGVDYVNYFYMDNAEAKPENWQDGTLRGALTFSWSRYGSPDVAYDVATDITGVHASKCTLALGSDGPAYETTYEYDDNGYLASSHTTWTYQDGSGTNGYADYQYDEYGTPVSGTFGTDDGQEQTNNISYEYDDSGFLTKYEAQDPFSNGETATRSFEYNYYGTGMTRQTITTADSTVELDYSKIGTSYDMCPGTILYREVYNDGRDPVYMNQRFTYNSDEKYVNSNVVEISTYNEYDTDDVLWTWTFEYDESGNLLSGTSTNGWTIAYEY